MRSLAGPVFPEQPMQQQSRTELVGIQPHGFKPPLFFFPTFCGETSYAHGIARYLGRDQPVWGVQPSDPISEGQSYLPLEEIARRYADDLCASQPDGSFRLAGYCFAGVLAYETACQLVDRGRQVKLVAVIESGISRDCPPTLAGVFGISLAIVAICRIGFSITFYVLSQGFHSRPQQSPPNAWEAR